MGMAISLIAGFIGISGAPLDRPTQTFDRPADGPASITEDYRGIPCSKAPFT